MQKIDVTTALNKIAKAKKAWAKATTEFNEDLGYVMRRLLNEAAANYMSAEEVAAASGFTAKRIRDMMRKNNLNPKNGKRLLAKQAADALASNAELMGIDPRQMDLMSPLAYLPMGEQMKQALTDGRIKGVTELPEQKIEAAIHLGISAEEDWDGPSIKPGTLTDDQIKWLASWLVGEGVTA